MLFPAAKSGNVMPQLNATGYCTARRRYASASAPENAHITELAANAVEGALRAAGGDRPLASEVLVNCADEWVRRRELQYQSMQFDNPDSRLAATEHALLACAPLALAHGHWLQWLSEPANAEDPLTLAVLARYADDIGVGHPRNSRADAYRKLLQSFRLAKHAETAQTLILDNRIANHHFDFPAMLLTMSRRPDRFRYEILGADLCIRRIGPLPALTLPRAASSGDPLWATIDQFARSPASMHKTVSDYTTAILELIDSHHKRDRLTTGFRWALDTVISWDDAVHSECIATACPKVRMAALLQQRARDGAVYHHRTLVAGKPLSDWLNECRHDPQPFLDALANSRLIARGQPDKSPLLRSLIGDRGPMFRIFSEAEVAVIRHWITSLPPTTTTTVAAKRMTHTSTPHADTVGATGHEDPLAEDGAPPKNIRDAYHQLLRRTTNRATHLFASRYTSEWLSDAEMRSDTPTAHSLPPEWPPTGLRDWLHTQHERHNREFVEEPVPPMPSRADLVDAAVQQAPLILIDGAWIHGFTDATTATSGIGHFLFEVYWDELGNGDPFLNHPRIYRALLCEMGVTLPATHTSEFACSPLIRTESFLLPVFWLSIGRLPRTYEPEILGLNLAMELSGVGGAYLRSTAALRHHGFPTRFVDIHNTIDNVATGHSAWAADAVDTYMNTHSHSGEQTLEQCWRRIRTGYCSLIPPNSPRVKARLLQKRRPFLRRRHLTPTISKPA
jgi:Iron-containing redox enzyme